MLPITFRKEVDPEFRRRANFLMTIVSLAFLFLIGRLFFLQILQGDRFTYLAENNRVRIKKIPGTRG
ncbi:MAG: penicillin-binding protein 2, partial [Candidatus Binatota bacterium]